MGCKTLVTNRSKETRRDEPSVGIDGSDKKRLGWRLLLFYFLLFVCTNSAMTEPRGDGALELLWHLSVPKSAACSFRCSLFGTAEMEHRPTRSAEGKHWHSPENSPVCGKLRLARGMRQAAVPLVLPGHYPSIVAGL